MRKILIHIGYQRTGTTWLQTHIFGRSFGCFYPVQPYKRRFTEDFILPNALTFDPLPLRQRYEALIADIPHDFVPVISNERLCGSTLSGGFDTKEIADRLHAMFPSASILIGVREQKDMIRSSYNNYLIAGGSASIERFLEPQDKNSSLPQFNYLRFEYDRTILYYRKLFGEENVLTMPHETLRQSPERYVAALLDLVGIKRCVELHETSRVNESMSPFIYPILRRLNPFIQSSFINGFSTLGFNGLRKPALKGIRALDRAMPIRYRQSAGQKFSDSVDALVGTRFADSNRRLQALTLADLAQLGYPLAPV